MSVIYEVKKHLLHPFTVCAAIFLIICNGGYMVWEYYYGGSQFADKSVVTKAEGAKWEYYQALHKDLDGFITPKKIQPLLDEYQRLNKIFKEGTYTTQYSKKWHTGYFMGDRNLIAYQFYQPLKANVDYQRYSQTITENAKENRDFYQEKGNSFEQSKNHYIYQHYQKRQVAYFFETKDWQRLFHYHFSDILLILLLLLSIVPLFGIEQEAGMMELIHGTFGGRKVWSCSKLLYCLVVAAFFTILFAAMNYVGFYLLYGMKGGLEMPLYGVTGYQATPLNMNLWSFYLLTVSLKLLGALSFVCVLYVLTRLFHQSILAFLVCLVAAAVFSFAASYYGAYANELGLFAACSPFVLFGSAQLFSTLLGFNLYGTFYLRAWVCVSMQFVIVIITLSFAWIFTKKRRGKRYVFKRMD